MPFEARDLAGIWTPNGNGFGGGETLKHADGNPVRRFRGRSQTLAQTWDGTYGTSFEPTGAPVPQGQYTATITATA